MTRDVIGRFVYWLSTLLFIPALLSAHEVYVLDQDTIVSGMARQSPNPFSAYSGNEFNFLLWGMVSFVVFSTVLFASLFRRLEKVFDPFLFNLKRFAHPIVRFTVGASLISFGIYGNLFGTELLFTSLFGTASSIAQVIFVGLGACVLLGIYARFISAIVFCVYIYAGIVFGSYIFTYSDHLGTYILIFILGSGMWSLDRLFSVGRAPELFASAMRALSPLAFPAFRILFGFGLMFASIYAKFIHSELALSVVHQSNLTDYFPFGPLFIVLGALIIEFLAGLMIFLGIELRWTSLFLLFWLTLSLLFFQEAVWPHIILIGASIAIFMHGYDRYSLEGRFFKKHGLEPVL
jgi:uncharacterized membrane protein YphA (DoxX/SURF4 family)